MPRTGWLVSYETPIFGRLYPALLVGPHNTIVIIIVTQWYDDHLVYPACIFPQLISQVCGDRPTSHFLSGDELEKLPQSDLIGKIEEVSTICRMHSSSVIQRGSRNNYYDLPFEELH